MFHDYVMHCLEDVSPLRMSIDLLDDLPYLQTTFNTPWTLDVGEITLDIAHLARCVTKGQKAHSLDVAPPEDFRVLMDAITFVEDGIATHVEGVEQENNNFSPFPYKAYNSY
jgi:hypothetical protein